MRDRSSERTDSLTALRDRLADGKFGQSLGEMALGFLAWEGRLAHMDPAATTGKDSAWSGKHLGPLGRPFADYFQTVHPAWAREDIDGAFNLFRAHCASLADWYWVMIQALDIKISFDEGLPQVPIEHAYGWHAASDCVDPDAIVTLFFAKEGPAQDIDQLEKWPPITRIGAHDLNTVLDRGISDLHVHLGGVRNAYIMWRKVMHEPDGLRHIPRYAPKTIDRLPSDEAARARSERDRINGLATVLADPGSPLGKLWSPNERSPRAPRDEILAEANTERCMLARAWRHLLSDTGVEKYELEAALDRYLFAKNNFLKRHRQPEKSSPGLAGFRRYFGATSPVFPKGRFNPSRYEISPKHDARAFAEYAAYLAQSHALKRLELRIGPKDSPAEYHQFFRQWAAVEKTFKLAKNGCDIRFAVHFKRTLIPKDGEDAAAALSRFLCELDHDSAQLHAYRRRSGEAWSEQDGRISRIDFAGQERDLPVQLAAFCMNLTRGQPKALKSLAAESVDERLHRFWRMHWARDEATQRVDLPKLGLTCHAGEDYAHPLEGIYSVASAVDLLEMSAGDTISHGLALGVDVEAFDRENSPTRLTSRGNQFDSLLWLLFELEQHHSLAASQEIVTLRNLLLDEVHKLYGREAAGMRTLQDLRGLGDERGKALPAATPPRREVASRLRYAEIMDTQCAGRRGERIPIDAKVYGMGSALKRVQARQIARLANMGIVLEFNPSSNLRVSGSGTISKTPFVAILNLLKTKCLATVNSDNPGVFGTRIENEFALVMRALTDEGFSRADALEVVERLRLVGIDNVYWPRKRLRGVAESDPDAARPV